MRTFLFSLLATSIIGLNSCNDIPQNETTDYTRYVNPFIGTDYTGNTYPGAQMPFGMVQLSPDNGRAGWDYIAGYFYPDSTIAGFSHTHLSGTGAGDLYDISFMPVTLPFKEDTTSTLGIHSLFSHDSEEAYAGYYKVFLEDYKINVELTATPRTGIQRYTFPRSEAMVILNLQKATNWDATMESHIEELDSCTVIGYRFSNGWARNQKVYFASRFSKPFKKKEILSKELSSKDVTKTAATGHFYFDTAEGEQLTVVTALSGVSIEGALNNLKSEAPHNHFDKYLAKAKKTWNEELGKIKADDQNKEHLYNFYTALYHSMLAPTLYNDVDLSYYGPDQEVHQAEGWDNYCTFSLWDTYRASHPLFTITQPERVNDMIKSFIAFFEQNKRLPVWNLWGSETDMMIGYHAVPVIADAYLKGIGDFDAEKALEACVASANIDNYRDIGTYKELGYIPYDTSKENWALSRTLEYAFDDYCIYRMAEKMGKKDIARDFYKRSQNYRKMFNPASGFMQPMNSKGEFQPDFDPKEYSKHICESNAWHYLWSVQQDIEGLTELLGGKQQLGLKLDSMFTLTSGKEEDLPLFSTGMIGQYAHGNEPSHHVAYLFNTAGEPWKTQQYVSRIIRDFYQNKPGGLCGNEDCGQMSAWYVFSAMGFYPVNPASGEYEIGVPLFKELSIDLPNGKTFTVKAPNLSEENCYIQSVKVNGETYHKSFITHQHIVDGAVVEFEMGKTTGVVWY